MPVNDQTPNVIIMDTTETPMEVSGGVLVPNGTKGLLFAGVQSDGSASYLLTDPSGRLTITGSLTVPNVVTVTGSLALSQTATVTGSVSVLNTVTVTGSVGITNFPVTQSVTGSVALSQIATVTGSITVPNLVSITGSVGVNGLIFVSGSNASVFISGSNLLTITGSVKLSEAIPSGSNNIGGVGITSSPSVGSTGSTAPRNAELVAGKDDAGNLTPLATDVSGTLYDAPLQVAILLGRFQGNAGVIRGQSLTGAAAEYALRFTTYTEQTSNAQRSINSTNANDTSAGTGARTVKITYYSLSGVVVTGPFTETITMNGTTAVNTVSTTICYVEKIEVITAGSVGLNVGAIQLFTTTGGGGTVFASISALGRSAKYAHHYVPTGRKCFVRNIMFYSTVSNSNAPTFEIRYTDLGTTNAAEQVLFNTGQIQGSTISVLMPFDVPRLVIGPARIIIYHTTVNGTNQIAYVESEFFEV